MADSIGVTASAVNKWEKGTTCPDVALLAPIARLLQIDLNTLFGFYEDVTQEEIISICRAVSQTAQAEGFEAGFSLAREKLHIYPNSEKLLHTMAMQLHGLLTAACLDEEESEEYMQSIAAWYECLTQSNDPVIRNSVNFMLASRAINAEQYEADQSYLDHMPSRSDTPDKRMLFRLLEAVWNLIISCVCRDGLLNIIIKLRTPKLTNAVKNTIVFHIL